MDAGIVRSRIEKFPEFICRKKFKKCLTRRLSDFRNETCTSSAVCLVGLIFETAPSLTFAAKQDLQNVTRWAGIKLCKNVSKNGQESRLDTKSGAAENDETVARRLRVQHMADTLRMSYGFRCETC